MSRKIQSGQRRCEDSAHPEKFERTPEERAERRLAFNEINEKFPTPLATVEHVVDRIDHMVSIAGIDHVGIDCDSTAGGGIDGVFDAE